MRGSSFLCFVVGIITLGEVARVADGLVVRVGEGITRVAVGVTVKTVGDLDMDGVPPGASTTTDEVIMDAVGVLKVDVGTGV